MVCIIIIIIDQIESLNYVKIFNYYRFSPRYMYDKPIYPNYLSGTGYVFSMDTAEKLYNVSMEIPLLHLEDVYLTGNTIFYFFSFVYITKRLHFFSSFRQVYALKKQASNRKITIYLIICLIKTCVKFVV